MYTPLRLKNTDNNGDKRLGDPITIPAREAKATSPSSATFDSITLLPTPILLTGSAFPAFSPLQVPKRGNRVPHDDSRIMSEYKPLGRKNSLLDLVARDSSPKRVPSDPIASDITTLIPSPPRELFQKYAAQLFYAPHSHKTYRYLDQIGKGNFSTVISACSTTSDADRVAIKILLYPEGDTFDFKSCVKRELSILLKLHHPCLIRLLDYNVDLDPALDKEQYFFLNYCGGGNLFQFASSHSKLNADNPSFWRAIHRIVCEVMVAVAYLHNNNIIHRDIKLENILLHHPFDELLRRSTIDEPLICITDFGLSKQIPSPNHLLSTRCGSQDYISPELLMGVKYNGRLTDSWAIGVVIYSILEDRLPFDPPPADFYTNSGVSPSVIQRRRAKNNPAHRIAMIDWDWFRMSTSPDAKVNLHSFDPVIQQICSQLKSVVDAFLVRKDKRVDVSSLINHPDFAWIKRSVPAAFYNVL